MNTVQRIAKNFGVLFTANMVGGILRFLCLMYAARYLGPGNFGVLSLALAYAEIFIVFSDIGLNTLTTREVAKDRSLADKYIGNLVVIKLILIICTLGLIALTMHFLKSPPLTQRVVYLVALSSMCVTFRKMFNAVFCAFEKMEYVSCGEVVSGMLSLVGTLVAVKQQFDVVGIALVYFGANLFALGYAFAVFLWRVAMPKIKIDWEFWLQILQQAWPLGGMALCIMIYFRIDTVMLSFMKGDMAVGTYSAAYRLSEAATVVPSVFMSSVFPLMAKYHEDSQKSFIKIYGKAVKYLFSLALPMALVVTFFSKSNVNLIYGPNFIGTDVTLRMLIWASAIMYVTMILGTIFVTANRQMMNFRLAIIVVLLNITLNLFLIPAYSYVGAAVSTVATEAFGLLVGIFFLHRWGYKLDLLKICLPSLFSFCIAGVVAFIFVSMGVPYLIMSLVAIAIYGVLLYRMAMDEDDKRLIRDIFHFSYGR